jgi:hypothetical protein
MTRDGFEDPLGGVFSLAAISGGIFFMAISPASSET